MNAPTTADKPDMPQPIRIRLVGPVRLAQSFGELFQKGFLIEVEEGATVREVVTGPMQVDAQYLDSRINTIFLNGHTVDNVDVSRVEGGTVLSLSASMPGFVGAALRKGGFYAVMRADITHAQNNHYAAGRPAQIIVRLYNMVARELGPGFLARGVWFWRSDLLEFLSGRSEAFWRACDHIAVDDQEIERENLMLALIKRSASERLAFVQVMMATAEAQTR
ncbi:MAG: hypothetical protein ACPL7J_14810 [Desulfomonilaceae bacterium]